MPHIKLFKRINVLKHPIPGIAGLFPTLTYTQHVKHTNCMGQLWPNGYQQENVGGEVKEQHSLPPSITTTEVPFRPPIILCVYTVCSLCVCSLFIAPNVYTNLDGLNAEDKFQVWVTFTL